MRIEPDYCKTDGPYDLRNIDETVQRLKLLKHFLPTWLDLVVVTTAPGDEDPLMILGLMEGDFFERKCVVSVGPAFHEVDDNERHLAVLEEIAHMILVPCNAVMTALRDFAAPGMRAIAKKVGGGLEEFAVKDLVRVLEGCDCMADQALREHCFDCGCGADSRPALGPVIRNFESLL